MKRLQGYISRVNQAINDSGMTRRELAERCGLARTYFYNIEATGAHMTAYTLARFCAVTGSSADYLLGLKEAEE